MSSERVRAISRMRVSEIWGSLVRVLYLAKDNSEEEHTDWGLLTVHVKVRARLDSRYFGPELEKKLDSQAYCL